MVISKSHRAVRSGRKGTKATNQNRYSPTVHLHYGGQIVNGDYIGGYDELVSPKCILDCYKKLKNLEMYYLHPGYTLKENGEIKVADDEHVVSLIDFIEAGDCNRFHVFVVEIQTESQAENESEIENESQVQGPNVTENENEMIIKKAEMIIKKAEACYAPIHTPPPPTTQSKTEKQEENTVERIENQEDGKKRKRNSPNKNKQEEDAESWMDEDLEGPSDDDPFHDGRNKTEKIDIQDVIGDDWWTDDEGDNEKEALRRRFVNSDDEVDGGDDFRGTEFNEVTNMENPHFEIDMEFTNYRVFRDAVREFSVKGGYDIIWIQNDKKRVTARCKDDNCKWRIHASKVQGEDTLRVKTLGFDHSCGPVEMNSLVTTNYLAKKYKDEIRDNPSWKLDAMQKRAQKDCNSQISKWKLYRAKKKAMATMQGDVREQYGRLHDYAETVIKLNPGTVFKFHTIGITEDPTSAPVFKRLYMRLDASKAGFLAGCRPIIGLDGCFLKGPYGGQLLSAIGRDANDNIFPIAIAVVECECRDSWDWFVTELVDDLGENDSRRYVFISDRQKGLVECLKEKFPNNEHRYCLKHLYNNFKVNFKGKELRDLFWEAASSGDKYGFNAAMKKLDLFAPLGKPTAAEWLNNCDPNSWALSHFSTHPRCDVLVNNINESWNAYILDARDKGIINMLEWIRRRLMTRFQVKRTGMLAYKGPFGPRIQKKLDKNKRYSRGCFPRYAGEGEFEVDEDDRTFLVHLNDKTCGCRLWALSGIPCKHAVAAIWANREQPEAYVHPCYSKEVYLQTYSYIIHPVPTHHEWEISELSKIEPPTYKKPTGRPRKERRRGADEPKDPHKSSKKNLTVTCSRCLTLGHNSRACKKPPHPDSKLMKKSGTSKGDKCGTSKTTEKGKEKMPQKGPSKSRKKARVCSQPAPSSKWVPPGTTASSMWENVPSTQPTSSSNVVIRDCTKITRSPIKNATQVGKTLGLTARGGKFAEGTKAASKLVTK